MDDAGSPPSPSRPAARPLAGEGPPFPIERVRAAFPQIAASAPFVFFDNAGGAQTPLSVVEAVSRHLLEHNAQRGAAYPKSRAVDAAVDAARAKTAALLGAEDPAEVAFGLNATAFMRTVSLAVGQTLGEGRDEIVVTDLDHHANISTWLELEKQGARIRWWRVREDLELHAEDLDGLLGPRTRLLACTAASNALGTRAPVRAAADRVHAAGAELFLDAVHFSPHGVLDVEALGCDYLVCSGYKAFGPHMGFLWGRRAALERLPTFREDFIPDAPPHKIEAGTFAYENVSGWSAALDYLAELGGWTGAAGPPGERARAALGAVDAYEQGLSRAMLEALGAAGAAVYGIVDPARLADRVPTFLFNLPGRAPGEVAAALCERGFGVRHGHMYAPRLTERLGLALDQGAVRASLVHYNHPDEIARFGAALADLAR